METRENRLVNKTNLKRTFEIVGVLLSIIGLAFAVDQFFEARRQENAFDNQQKVLRMIALKAQEAVEASTTHSIGNFPDNLHAITEVVKSACNNLVIMADVAGYGMYSKPDDFDNYLLAVEAAASTKRVDTHKGSACIGVPEEAIQPDGNIDVWMVLYDPERLRQTLRNQFKEEGYAATAADSRFANFFDRHRELKRPQNYTQFIDALVQAHLGYANELEKHRVKIKYSNHRYTIYFWMHDAVQSAFSLDYQGDLIGDVEREITFTSRDGKMTNALSDIFCLEWKKAIPSDEKAPFCSSK